MSSTISVLGKHPAVEEGLKPTGVVVKQEEAPEAKRMRSNDDDVVEVSPASDDRDRKPSALMAARTGEIEVTRHTGHVVLMDFPHARADCLVHPLEVDNEEATAEQYCENCYCYVCDVPVPECGNWVSHCHSRAGKDEWEEERARKKAQKQANQQEQAEETHDPQAELVAAPPTEPVAVTIPTAEAPAPSSGLFDFEKECGRIREQYFPHGKWNDKIEALRQRAASCFYYYRDVETFLAAIELHCRNECQWREERSETEPSWHALYDWVVLPIAEIGTLPPLEPPSQRNSCHHCDREFSTDRMTHFVTDKGPRNLTYIRYCLGCVGHMCVLRYGANKKAIMQQLLVHRAKQTAPTCPKPFTEHYDTLPLLHAMAQHPHLRQDCVVHPFCTSTTGFAVRSCANCKCYVCDVPASQCAEWESHAKAIKGVTEWDYEYEKRHPEEKPQGLFDFKQENERLNWNDQDALTERANQHQYVFKDEEAFVAALELYRRQNGRSYERSTGVGTIKYFEPKYGYNLKRKEVAGRHRNPCDQCGKDFNGEKYYIVDDTDSFSGYRAKVCTGCMGRNLCFKYGSRKATILTELEKWREVQKDRMEGDVFITYRFD